MTFDQQRLRVLSLGLFLALFNHASAEISSKFGDCVFTLSGKYRPESFFGENLSDLNKSNSLDTVIRSQHVFDGNLDVKCPSTEFFVTFRNRAIWGNTESTARTTQAETELFEGVWRKHTHGIPYNFPRIREIWLQFNINEPFALPINDTHKFTIGAFPFQLGRGIALGDAYAVGPDFLGFYTDNAIDQYAYGAMFDGDFVPGIAHYAFYAAMLQNKTTSLADNSKFIRLQESGYFDNPERGFGHVNFVAAMKVNAELFNGPMGRLAIEPYAMYTADPEQCIEYPADSSTKMGTLGMATEYYGPSWEGGFDCAFNIGRQNVRPWDRNKIEVENRCGNIVMVNTHIVNAANTKERIAFIPGSESQGIIIATNRAAQCEALNGNIIGTVTDSTCPLVPVGTELQNAANRFRNKSCNSLSGWMMVSDAMYNVYPKCFAFGGTLGVASGDADPNMDTTDRHYKGFISLQEGYTGKRIKSAIVLPGRVVRPMGAPHVNMLQSPSKYPRKASGFNNLVFGGATVNWSPCCFKGAVSIKPNVLAFWQYDGTNKYDAYQRKEINCPASKFLGTELNAFMDYSMSKNLRLFVVLGVFVPGQHFCDIKGKPLNSDQARKLEKIGVNGGSLPNIGNDTAYMFNIALETYF